MNPIVGTTIETEDAPGRFCIPGSGDGSHLTLCGFVDVLHKVHDAGEHPCNCQSCMEHLRIVKAMRIKRGYFANVALTSADEGGVS